VTCPIGQLSSQMAWLCSTGMGSRVDPLSQAVSLTARSTALQAATGQLRSTPMAPVSSLGLFSQPSTTNRRSS